MFKVTATLADGKTVTTKTVTSSELEKMLNSPWCYITVKYEKI